MGKQTGKDKFCCWIQCGSDDLKVDFVKDIEDWKYCTVQFANDTKSHEDESKVITEIMFAGVNNLKKSENDVKEYRNDVYVTNIPSKFHDDPAIIEAKKSELEKWDRFKEYEGVKFNGQRARFAVGSSGEK